jgi:hypothetical protein
MGLSFKIAADPRQRSSSRVRVRRDGWPYFTVSDSRLPQPGGLGPHRYIPQQQDSTVLPPCNGFHFRCFLRLAELRLRYSNPPPHGVDSSLFWLLLHSLDRDRIENTTSHSFCIVLCVSVAKEMYLQSRCLAIVVSFFIVPAFMRHVALSCQYQSIYWLLPVWTQLRPEKGKRNGLYAWTHTYITYIRAEYHATKIVYEI